MLKPKKIDRKFVYLLLIGIFVQFFFFLGIDNFLFRLVGLILSILPILIFKSTYLILLVFLLIPNQRLLVLNEGGASIINLYFVLLFFQTFFSYYISSINKKKYVLGLVLFVVYGAILSLLNNGLGELLLLIKVFVVIYVLSFYCLNFSLRLKSYVIYSFITGVVITSLFGFISSGFGSVNRFDGGDLNEPNYFGSICAISLALIVFLFKSEKIHRYIFYITSLFLSFMGLLTQSRSFLLCLVLIIFTYLITGLKKAFFKTIFILFGVVVFFSSIIINFYNNSTLLNNISERVLNPRNEDVSGGRFEIWSQYETAIFSSDKNLYFGIGSSAFQTLNFDQVAHNFFIEDVVTIGVLGVFVSYFFLFIVFKEVSQGRIYLISLLPLIVFLTTNMTLHSFLGMGGLTQIFLCFLTINLYNLIKDENINYSRIRNS